jgi:nitroreductase
METEEAIRNRQSIRAYLPTPVPQEVIAEILEISRWAPSGTNRQNWRVTVATGAPLQRLADRMEARVRETKPRLFSGENAPPEVQSKLESLRSQMRRVAEQREQSLWEFVIVGSYRFFDAPAVVIVSHRGGNASNVPIFVTTMLLAAHDRGLGTCWLGYPLGASDLIREALGIPEEEQMRAVVALGYPDLDAPANGFRTSRDEVETFVQWVGFESPLSHSGSSNAGFG